MALTDSLIAFWELEEASGSRLDSHGSNHLTDNNTVTQTTGKVGNCGQFTAANNESLSIADNADLSTGDINYTICAWVMLDSKTTFRMIANKFGDTQGTNQEYSLRYTSSSDRFELLVRSAAASSSVESSTLGSPATGTWYFIVAWHDADNDLLGISVNAGAADIASPYTSGSINGTAPFEIGNASAFGLPMDGRIDQVGFWKRVLTSQERADLYNGGAGLSYAAMSGGGGGVGMTAPGRLRQVRNRALVRM
jgi:hypothetical protein